MRKLFDNTDGSFSVETLIVLTSLCVLFTTMLTFILAVFTGIDELCETGIAYDGYLPAVIHRFVNVSFQTGGEIFEKIG